MPRSKKIDDRRRDLVREGLLLLAIAAQAFILVALVAYSPQADAQEELVGVVGRFVSVALYGAVGVVSLPIVVLGIYTTALALLRRDVSTPLLRIVGGVLMLLGACTLVQQFFPEGVFATAGEAPHTASGGLIGEVLFGALAEAFGQLGTFVLSVVLLCTGFAFATDWLVYEMLFQGARKLGELTVLLRRFWPEPVLAGASGGTSAPPKPKTKKTTAKATDAAEPVVAKEPEAAAPEPSPVSPPPAEPAPEAASSIEDSAGAPVETVVELDDPVVSLSPELTRRLEEAEQAQELEREPAAPVSSGNPLLPDLDEEPEEVESGTDEAAEVADEDAEDESRPILNVELDEEPEPRPATLQLPRTRGDYEFPSHQLLDRPKPRDLKGLARAIQKNADTLQKTLAEFKVEGEVVDYQQGPVVTMLEVSLAPGTKVTKIHSLADDLAMALKASSVRIVAPIPGKSTVGVEIPNPTRSDVRMLSIMESEIFAKQEQEIPLLLGVGADGSAIVNDLAKMPHLLIAGATGAGKSVCINTILLSMLLTRTPDEVKLILVDPKQVELAFFADIPHLLAPVVTDMKRAAPVLDWAVNQMEDRYELLRRFEVRNIVSYNELGEKAIRERAKEIGAEDEVIPVQLPYIVIVVDELADLMMTTGKEIEKVITRLAQKSRAVGIHIILATQRPSTDVITGLIKANMPTRIAFKVTSKVDSRVIMDQNGAEKLLGMGDMLYLPPRSSSVGRAQGTYAADSEVKRVVKFLKERYKPEFDPGLVRVGTQRLLDAAEKDPLYDEAVRVVLGEQRGSASLLQRALGVGYTRGSRLLDQMRKEGVVGEYRGSKASEVMMTLEEYEERVQGRGK